jgi:excisionase family DNA binding protein
LRLLTMTEVSERTRMPVETLRHWRKHGKGPAGFKVGRRVLYDEDAVDGWLREQMQTANGQ